MTIQPLVDQSASADSSALPDEGAAISVPARKANHILISVMICSMILPLLNAMTTVALPVIRDDFQLQADTTAWIGVAFTLPFTILTPLYGRLSDGWGRRRLLLSGLLIFCLGTVITLSVSQFPWLLIGRAVQGVGLAGIMPLSMAIVSSIFPRKQRGRAFGAWSMTGPAAFFVGPLLAGFLVAALGWRGAFVVPLLLGMLAFAVFYKVVPAGISIIKPNFLRGFDWGGVILLAGALTSFLFFVSSRSITGVASLQDWRLLAVFLLSAGALFWWERRQKNPLLLLALVRDRRFSRGTLSAAIRMVGMGGIGFLLPLYLVDIHALTSTQLGLILMITPGAMLFLVRYGGQASDRWGSKWLVVIGMSGQAAVMLIFSQLPGTAPMWLISLVLVLNGLSVGLTLAALHNAAMGGIPDASAGAAAGIYAMMRFFGVAIGGALSGVILQHFLDLSLPTLQAYQYAFLFLAGCAAFGLITAFGLRD